MKWWRRSFGKMHLMHYESHLSWDITQSPCLENVSLRIAPTAEISCTSTYHPRWMSRYKSAIIRYGGTNCFITSSSERNEQKPHEMTVFAESTLFSPPSIESFPSHLILVSPRDQAVPSRSPANKVPSDAILDWIQRLQNPLILSV
jgi:hypothetical protein